MQALLDVNYLQFMVTYQIELIYGINNIESRGWHFKSCCVHVRSFRLHDGKSAIGKCDSQIIIALTLQSRTVWVEPVVMYRWIGLIGITTYYNLNRALPQPSNYIIISNNRRKYGEYRIVRKFRRERRRYNRILLYCHSSI